MLDAGYPAVHNPRGREYARSFDGSSEAQRRTNSALAKSAVGACLNP